MNFLKIIKNLWALIQSAPGKFLLLAVKKLAPSLIARLLKSQDPKVTGDQIDDLIAKISKPGFFSSTLPQGQTLDALTDAFATELLSAVMQMDSDKLQASNVFKAVIHLANAVEGKFSRAIYRRFQENKQRLFEFSQKLADAAIRTDMSSVRQDQIRDMSVTVLFLFFFFIRPEA
jgi:hypothetical protein